MRNGIVADALRRGGCPYRLVYGVNLPQLNEIASSLGPSVELAEQLHSDGDLRESRLLANMVYPPTEFSISTARQWCDDLRWSEDADILCFKLLRKVDFAPELAEELCSADSTLKRYAGLRLWLNIVNKYPEKADKAAQAELDRLDSPLRQLASMLAEEASLFH